jgi:hypothetical protein
MQGGHRVGDVGFEDCRAAPRAGEMCVHYNMSYYTE